MAPSQIVYYPHELSSEMKQKANRQTDRQFKFVIESSSFLQLTTIVVTANTFPTDTSAKHQLHGVNKHFITLF
jgi:hypothetical protein